MILSILIPTIPKRANMFTLLFNEVHRQIQYMDTFHPTLGPIEVIVDDSPAFLDGGLSIGGKRDALLRRAKGKYICYVDDDEWIAPNYLETIVRLAQYDKDILTFNNITKTDNYWTIVKMSLENKVNEEARPGFIKRRPWHVCGARRRYAKCFKFDNTNYGEDWSWFEKVLEICETEEHSEAIIHEYRHNSKVSESDKITAHELLSK